VTVTWYHTGVVMCCCSSANKCLLKVAQYSAQRELFEKAAEIYEQVSVLCKFVSSTISDRAVYFYSFHRLLPMYCVGECEHYLLMSWCAARQLVNGQCVAQTRCQGSLLSCSNLPHVSGYSRWCECCWQIWTDVSCIYGF